MVGYLRGSSRSGLYSGSRASSSSSGNSSVTRDSISGAGSLAGVAGFTEK